MDFISISEVIVICIGFFLIALGTTQIPDVSSTEISCDDKGDYLPGLVHFIEGLAIVAITIFITVTDKISPWLPDYSFVFPNHLFISHNPLFVFLNHLSIFPINIIVIDIFLWTSLIGILILGGLCENRIYCLRKEN